MVDDEEPILKCNENLKLFVDDDGVELHNGDIVLVNNETAAMIRDIDGDRMLIGFPVGERVDSIRLLPKEPDLEWPDRLFQS